MKDYDGIFKPLAGDVLDITGNNTTEKYNRDSLLEKREFFRLINACKDNIDLFKDWLNNNYYRLNKDNKSVTTFKNESEINISIQKLRGLATSRSALENY